MKALEAAPSAPVRKAVARVNAGRAAAVEQERQVRQGVEQADQFFAGVAQGAMNGEYERSYEAASRC